MKTKPASSTPVVAATVSMTTSTPSTPTDGSREESTKAVGEEKRTLSALRACAEWVSFCVTELKWGKEQIPFLEKMWWEHHDGNGRLKQLSRGSNPSNVAGSSAVSVSKKEE